MSGESSPSTASTPAPASAEAVPPRPEVPSWRLIVTLAIAGGLAGFLLVYVFQATAPIIAENKARALREAVRVVLKDPLRFEARYVYDDALTSEDDLPEGVGVGGLETVWLGFDAADEPVGFAIVGVAKGYADDIRLIFGYDPRAKAVLGMKVLESKETPGLGDAIEKNPAFVGQFDGALHPLVQVKQGKRGSDRHNVDLITGATISSRTVVGILQARLDRLAPLFEAWVLRLGRAGGGETR